MTGIDTRTRIHLADDENGFVETLGEVRRVRGKGLGGLATAPDALHRLRAMLAPDAPAEPVHDTAREPAAAPVHRLAVYGPRALTRHLLAVTDGTPGTGAVDVGELPATGTDADGPDGAPPALVILATASLFDPRAAALSKSCVERGLAHLVYGIAGENSTFAGPLWCPRRGGACYACLRMRVCSNSVHGATWRDYMRLLDRTGGRPVQHGVAPWTAARLAAAVGRRVAGWLADPRADHADELLWGDDSGPDPARRHLLPVPNCPVCSGHPAERPEEEDPDAIGMAAVEDDRVGIVHGVSVRRAESGPAVYLSGSVSADFSLLKPPMRVTRNGGAGFTKSDAVAAAIGESLERYAAGFYRGADLRLARWCDLGQPAVHPGEFGLFAPHQYEQPGFPFLPFGETTPVRWAPSTDWLTGETVLAPASQVHMHYRRVQEEAPIGPSISTGLAAGPTFRQAVLSGLYEIIERDALAISWLHRLPPRPMPADAVTASSRVSYLVERAKTWRVRFHDLSLDLSPATVVAVMEHHSGSEQIMSFGSACRWSPTAAVEKAFLEAAQGLTYVRRLLRQHEDWEMAEDFSDVDDFNKHAILYSKYPGLRERAGYLVHPTRPAECLRPERPAPPAEDDPLDRIAAELRDAGHRVLVADLTTPDVRRAGVHVVRVLVPGLQHLSGVHSCRLLGSRRLNSLPAALGFGSLPDNPYPHPLP
ncbi:TOMM precursor leader peptide-binding protein [Streptomyces orinoci]|uniref:TOMM leader peptide-binding protein n=1 Tax=Streptomyces orinoci TaxID=67339 RepID=A0ABV3JQK0_STRON|nr:TOMM precursor leader peptide-binding protein [Streptomyces orinoci]